MQTRHQIADSIRSFIGAWTPVPSKSQFAEKGTLTPQEFLEAGEQLTYKFPSWQWQSAASKHQVPWLPPDKQFLTTKGVVCSTRVKDLDDSFKERTKMDEDWLLPVLDGDDGKEEGMEELDEVPETQQGERGIPDMSKLSLNGAAAAAPVQEQGGGEEEIEEIEEMGEFDDIDQMVMEQEQKMPRDPATTAGPVSSGAAASSSSSSSSSSSVPSKQNAGGSAPGGGGILGGGGSEMMVAEAPPSLGSRTYDLTITYDKYYMTPRLWLFGYDESGRPLKPQDIFEDVLTQYASKTVTVDPHPCTGIPTASIHPCKHSQVMKKVVDQWIEEGAEPRHDLSLFVFLKFMSSVIPTINYDFTMDIDGQKLARR
uniref:Uncharacterized protein n=1 Tax=Chromera velia CCMP2878 TaxID=1169474 RepID=A0A0G4FIR0_9ALVE|eukprot:Cvel_17265.t1-p1 / transcript=Cvel_17265.t1 / gene=Cvel_17265 / organism=Chromera_velia_CCMP2878 / gene_product=Autophagy-related protein 3, putative / transcript_product=Autophagy-related protein 3, putative / location=Cvel_scaffold1368:38882-44567(+) / protein_length=368 / sequence_SO=supercontig / SO=protein_coding / is_pseudo=false